MIITSEIIQSNLLILDKAINAFPKLQLFKNLLDEKDKLSNSGSLFTKEWYRIDEQISTVREECRTYKLNSYLDFIEFINSSKKYEQEIFYKKKIKNIDLQTILSKYAVDDEAKLCFSKKTKSTFTKLINSKKWEVYLGDYRPRNRNSKRFSDNMFRTHAIIANYCIQNKIDVSNLSRIKTFYTNLLPEPDLKVSQEISRTSSIIDYIIHKFTESDSDFRKINLEHLILSIKNELRSRILSLGNKEKIKCIEVPNTQTEELTLNKIYEVLDTRLESGVLKVQISNDKDQIKLYYFRNFETMTILRDSFIDDLLGD